MMRKEMTEAQRKALDRQIKEAVEALKLLRTALAKVDYDLHTDVITKCVARLERLKRDLARLKKRKAELWESDRSKNR